MEIRDLAMIWSSRRNNFIWADSPGGGGGGTLIFSYIRRLGPFFWGQIFEFQYFWGFSEK